MQEKTFTYVYYPGHLGRCPMTELTSERGILWNAPVKRVPEPFASSLIRDGGFQLALDFDDAAKALGLSKAKLRDLAGRGLVESAVYKPSREGEPEVALVVVRPGLTTVAFRDLLSSKTKPAETEPTEKETTDV